MGEVRPAAAAMMTRAAPLTGSSAATPGNGVAAVNVAPATRTIAIPTQAMPSLARSTRGDDPSAGSVAMQPPSASSQTRVGVMKYALAGSACVASTETASEAQTTDSMASRTTGVGARLTRRTSQKAPRSRIGQSR